MSFLVLDDLTKQYPARGRAGVVQAVDRVNLSIARGEFITFLGPSGCGKTTTLRLIGGFETPTAGQIRLNNQVIDSLPPNKRDMAMVFQSYAIFPHLTVFENIAYGLRIKRVPEREIHNRVGAIMGLAGLQGMEQRAPNQLSGGQQQRVALARALVMEPKVLLLDEPLSNLDAKLREIMRAELRRIHELVGITSIYVTHDQEEAMTLSDRIVVMNHARIEQVGAPVQIYQRPATRFVAQFIGRANLLDAIVAKPQQGQVVVSLFGSELTALADPPLPTPGARVTVLARPEAIRLHAQPHTLTGVVQRTTYLGPIVEYEVMVGDQALIVVDADPRRPTLYPTGTTVGVEFLSETLYVLPEPAPATG